MKNCEATFPVNNSDDDVPGSRESHQFATHTISLSANPAIVSSNITCAGPSSANVYACVRSLVLTIVRPVDILVW